MQNSNLINNGNFDFEASSCSDPNTIIDAEDNFWVATDSITIANEHVYDNSDDSESPIVDFVPFLMEEIRGTISGTVTDQMSEPVPDVLVSAVGTDTDDYTDANGEYILDGFETDYYEVSFFRAGYSDTAIAGVFVKIGNDTILDVAIQSPCSYVIGDCDHNGIPIELIDVMAMVSMYRGTTDPPYTCFCPPNGNDFAPGADPNGNCTAYEIEDVVKEIDAYRGPVLLTGCEDCPGSLRLLQGGGDQPLTAQSLKARAKISGSKIVE